MRRCFLLSLFILFTARQAVATEGSKDAPLEGLDSFIADVMSAWNVSGLELAVPRDDVKGLPGCSLESKKDAAGAVGEVVFYQPNGTFVAKSKVP